MCLEVSLGAKRVRDGGCECVLGGSRWSGLGQGGESGWGMGLVW